MTLKTLIADDNLQDIDLILHILKIFESAHYDLSFDTVCVHSLKELETVLCQSSFDLLTLDLGFESEGSSSISLIEKLPSGLPIIIISNLSHYRQSLIVKKNIRGFILKSAAERELPLLLEQLYLKRTIPLDEEKFFFPSSDSGKDCRPSFSTDYIRYIYHLGRRNYEITFVDGTRTELHSSTVAAVRSALQEQHTRAIVPISQNEFVNITLIKSIRKRRDGRIEIRLIGEPDKPHIISNFFADPFKKMLQSN